MGNLTVGKVVQGQSTDNKGENNTAIGTQSDTLRNVTEGDTTKNGQPMDAANTRLVDGEGEAHKLDTSTESGGSTAVGYNNKAEGDNSTAIGNTAKITNKPITYYADKDGKKTTSTTDAAWYKDSSGNPTQVPQVFRDADGNTTTAPQYVHTYTVKDPDTGEEITKTEITSDATKADQKDGKPVYNYQKSDNLDKLYSVTLYQAASNSIAAGSHVTANGNNAVAVGYNSTADNSAVAVGDTAVAKENAVAIGKNTKASVEGAIALGKGSEADRSGGITGWDPKTDKTSINSGLAWKSTEGALSIGNGSASRQITGVAAGSEDTDAVNLAQLKNAMTHYYSVKTTADTDAAGNNNYLNDGATGNNALAAGVSAVATGDNATAVGTNTYASGEDASAYGYRAAAMGKDSVSIGSGTSAQQEGAVAIGGHAIGSNSIAIGSDYRSNRVSAAGSSSIAIGGYTNSDYNVAIGSGSSTSGQYAITVGGSATSERAVSIGGVAGNSQATAVGSGSSATGQQSTAIGAYSAVSGQRAIAIGGTASGDHAVSVDGVAGNPQATAVGYGSTAKGTNSTAVGGQAGDLYATAVGQGANATYVYTTAVGYNSVASGSYSTALGNGTSVQGSNSTAIGGASAKGTNVTAIGKDSTVGGYWDSSVSDSTVIGGAHINIRSGSLTSGTAIGSNASVTDSYGVALGQDASVAYRSTGVGTETKASNTGTAVGYNAQSSGYQSAAVGAGSNATGQNAVSLGGGGAWGNYSIALGSGAGTTAHGIALGQNSGAWGENAIAIGEGTNAWRANSIVFGKNSKSGADKNIEGYDPRTGMASVDDTSTWQSTDEAVSIGRAEERDGDGKITATAITRQLNNLAAGTLDTDAVNVAQLKAATQKVNVHDYSVWSPDTETDTNYTNEGAVAKNSMAAGVSASATAENAVAIGYKAKAEGVGATVIGQYGTVTGRYALAFGGQQTDATAEQANNVASGDNAVSFGERTAASANNSTAFGWQTKATEKRATAFGERTTASGANSTAFGQLAVASGQNSTAFGNEALANNYGTTAFGNRTEALGAYSTAFGNSTVAAGMNTVAFGTDNVAGAVLDDNGAYTNIIYQTNPKNGRVVKDSNGNPIEISREKMDARGNLAYTDSNGNTKSVTYTVSGGETHSYVLLQGEDGNTYIRDYRGNIRSAAIGSDGTVTVGDKALTDVTLKKATSGANGYNILSNANATVWGENSNASGEASTAFGVNSTASAKNSLAALGGTTTDAATNAAAIGSGAKATLADSVALGSGALANRASGSKGYDVLTGTASTNTSAAWVSNANALAIGNDTEGSLLTRQITGVAAGSLDTDAVNVAQLKGAGLSFTTNTKDASNTTDNYKGYKVVSRKLGDTISIKASDEAANHSYSTANLTTRIAENGDISILMDENPAFTSVTTSDVIFAGNPDLTDKDGKAAKADTNAAYGTKTLTDSQNITSAGNDTQATRLHYKDAQNHTYELATMDDGQIYAGDIKADGTVDSTGFARTMNQKTTINGGVTNKDNLTGNNIGVVSNGTDTLTVKLAKDLKDLHSVTTGKTVQDNSGIKITNNAGDETKNVIINGDQIFFGGNQVNNMGSGSDGTADGKPTYNTDTNGANIGDVKNIASSTVQPVIDTVNKGWELDVNGTKQKAVTPTNPKVNLIQGQNITITGDKDNMDNVTIATADDVRFNTVRVGGTKTGDTYSGGIVIGIQSGKNADGTESANSNDDYYITGLKNTNWDSNKIQSGRAATEDQLAKVSEAINNAAEAAGKRTVVTVNDKSNPATAEPGANAYGEYDTQNGNLMIAAKKDTDGVLTYNIKLNDKLTLGKDGADGQEGTIGMTGKDGLPGADGKQGYSTTIIKTEKGQAGKDGKTGKENLGGTDITRIVYTDKDGQNAQTVATLDDGLKFVGNDGQEVTRKLNETLSIKGGLDKDAVATASSKNLGVRKSGDGLEIVMTDTPDFTKVTVGGNTKITIGGQTNSDTQNPANGNYITGLDNTKWDKDHVTENRAATEGQLKEAINEISGKDKGGFGLKADDENSVKKDLGDTVTVKGDGKNIETKVNDGALEVSLKKDVDLGNDGSIKAGNTTVNSNGVETNKVTIKDSTISISKDGINAGGKQITNVESGGDVDTNAANIGDVKRIAGDMKTEITNNVTDVTNKVNKMGDELTQVQKDVKADRQYLGDEGTAKKVNVKFGSALSLTGGAKVDSLAGEGNIGVIQKEMDNPDHAGEKINGFSIRLAKDLTGLNSVTTGNTTINNSGLTVKTGDANRTITVQDGNVNMGGNQIHNVAPGTAPTDAVNVSQLQQTGRAINQLGNSVNKLGARVDRVGANSAALAALHPLDFDPDDKLDFAVGAGSYSGANAVALGAFYRPNEDVMFSLGGSTGGGENMVNIGATFKLGQHNHVSNSRVAMAKEIRGLKELVAKQEGEMQQLKTLMNQMAGRTVMKVDKDALFLDIPENHWAYDYVTKLAKAGIVEGYEDGEFKGNRMMTRYEFAAVIYRAIMAGAGSNPALDQDGTLGKLVKEFDGELKYIRIDVIEKDKHGNPTIERVRTVEDSEKHHGK